MAAKAAGAFITDQVEDSKRRQFADLVPGIVQVMILYCFILVDIKLILVLLVVYVIIYY